MKYDHQKMGFSALILGHSPAHLSILPPRPSQTPSPPACLDGFFTAGCFASAAASPARNPPPLLLVVLGHLGLMHSCVLLYRPHNIFVIVCIVNIRTECVSLLWNHTGFLEGRNCVPVSLPSMGYGSIR